LQFNQHIDYNHGIDKLERLQVFQFIKMVQNQVNIQSVRQEFFQLRHKGALEGNETKRLKKVVPSI